MAIPAFQEVMLPILKFAADGKAHSIKESVDYIECLFHLTETEKQQRVPSGTQRRVYNNTTWAITYLRKAGLLESGKERGLYTITDVGHKLLDKNPTEINLKLLEQYQSYKDFVEAKQKPSEPSAESTVQDTDKTPEETINALSDQLNLYLADEILETIYSNSPTFFERLVIDLLLKMGYGGLEGWGEVTKKTGDGGIDGIIKQDELGLDLIYVQAKRWDKGATVSRPDIQKFVGAVLGDGVTKGIFITTTSFAKPAIDYAKSIPNAKITLIDGMMLAKLMIKYNLGVKTIDTLYIKKVDSDYFDDDI
jgi:restriction system protein